MERVTKVPKLNPRPVDGHKGTFGKVLIVGGSLGFSGAPALAGKAALRSGSGLVRVAVPQGILPIVAALDPCYTTVPLADDADGKIASQAAGLLIEQAKANDVVVFGPGVGVSSGVRDVLLELLQIQGLRILIDADGLNVLADRAKMGDWPAKTKASLILTPHPGEMSRLWACLFRKSIPESREQCAAELAKKTQATVVLKGAGTVVADSKRLYFNTTGNPGMATAGSGDVLSGVIAALAGQGLSDFDAAALGAYIHGLAGDLAAQDKTQISLIATDIIEYLPKAFSSIQQ